MIVGNCAVGLSRACTQWWRLCLTAAFALVLNACDLGPQYQHPVIPLPTTWQSAQSGEGTTWPSVDWWQGFESPQLDALIAQARYANDDIAAAEARVREADAQTRIVGASLLPVVDGSANALRARSRSSGISSRTYTEYSPQISASYELDFWGKNRAALKAARASAVASRYDRETVELTVLTGVASTYFQVLELRDRLNIVQHNLKSARTILQGLQFEVDTGTGNALDVAQQETALNTLYATVPPLQQQLRQSMDALAILIGSTPESLNVSGTLLAGLSLPRVRAGLPSGLLARRPDVAEAEAQLVAANADIAQARAAFFPDIQLTASGGFESQALSSLLDPTSEIFSLAAGLTQPIFEGGALRGRSDYTKARYAELLAEYHKTVLSAFANVEDALAAVQQTGEQSRRQQQAVDTATRAYRIGQAQMRVGTIDVLTLLNTESALFTTEDAMSQVRYSHLRALIGLFNALGGGWQLKREG